MNRRPKANLEDVIVAQEEQPRCWDLGVVKVVQHEEIGDGNLLMIGN